MTQVTFRHAFHLKGADGLQPPGTYAVETDEELIAGLSFPAYRRVSTTIALWSAYGGTAVRQMVTIDPADLEEAQKKDLQSEVP
jgi:hypothetical protein